VSADEPSLPSPPRESEPPPGALAATPEIAPAAPVPVDADDTRGLHFRRLATSAVTLVLTAIVAVAALLAAGLAAGWAIGGAAAAGAVVLALLIVFLLASQRAADDFFTAYAKGRGLARIDGKSTLPPLTPLLRKGDRRYAEQRFNGRLPGGLDGSLCLYTYEEETRDSDGNRQTTYVHHTIVVTEVPETAPFLHELFCNRRFGFRFLDSMEDAFRKRQRVEHESEAVDKEFEIFAGENDDLNRARQVLSPTFLVWLESHSPQEFAFELVAGSLVTNIKGHKKASAELDLLCEASAAIARRLQDEASELAPR
jgi:hypothetical protein